jgi:DNA-binding NarL/FixJ family response regulator
MDSNVQLAEIKSGRKGSIAPLTYANAKLCEATAGEVVWQAGDSTSESVPEQSRSVRCAENFDNSQNQDVLWRRDEPIEVAIVDGDAESRFFLRQVLEQSGGYRCVGAFASGEDALREIPRVRPRIVLMDVRMPGISGIECMRRLKARLQELIVVLVSELTDAETMSAALEAGGDAYLTKPFAVAQCLATVRFSLRRNHSAPPDKADDNGSSTRVGDEPARLTNREHDVMNCLAKGLLYKEIADELRLSFSTVHKLLHRIFLKLHVNNRTEAVTRWRHGNRA